VIAPPWVVAVIAGTAFLCIGLIAGGRAETHWNNGEPAPTPLVRLTLIGLGGYAVLFVAAAVIMIAEPGG